MSLSKWQSKHGLRAIETVYGGKEESSWVAPKSKPDCVIELPICAERTLVPEETEFGGPPLLVQQTDQIELNDRLTIVFALRTHDSCTLPAQLIKLRMLVPRAGSPHELQSGAR